jgi:membrane fusion protein (multidrug efflux system)
MKRIPVWLIVIVVIGLLIASKFIFFPKKEEKVSAKPQGGGPSAMSVTYHVTKAAPLNNQIFATGKIGALNEVNLVAEAVGKVTKINFKEGETVKEGTVLVRLNDADLQAQLIKIRTQLKLSEHKLSRLKKLLEVEGVSKEEYEMQENEVAAFKADETYVNAQIARTNIVAPFTGVVGLKNVSEGSYVTPNTPVVSLVQMRPVFVEFSVPEKYHDKLSNGLTVSFGTENSSAEGNFDAKVYAIEPKVDEATKTIRARALYDGKTTFYPGSFVRVNVNLGQVNNAIMVPTQCVIPTIDGQKVFVVKQGTATEAPVKIGVRTESAIEITEGLAPGDTIVASGMLGVKQGMKLKLTQAVN